MPQSIQNERSKLELQDFMNKSNILSKSLGIKPEEAYKIVRPAILENPNVQKFIENINKSKEESNQKENQNAQPAPASTQAAPAQPAPSNGYQNVQPAPAISYAQPYAQPYGYPQPQPYGQLSPAAMAYVQPQPYVQPYAQPQAYGYPNMMDNWYQSKVTTEMEARRRQQEEQNRNVAYYQPDSSPEVENESDEADLVSDVGQIM